MKVFMRIGFQRWKKAQKSKWTASAPEGLNLPRTIRPGIPGTFHATDDLLLRTQTSGYKPALCRAGNNTPIG